MVLDGLPGLYELKYDRAIACGLPLYLCSYKLVGSATSYLLDSPFTIKKCDPGIPTITCSIGTHTFHNALCDLGSSVNIMSKATYDKLFYTTLAPTSIYVQLADAAL